MSYIPRWVMITRTSLEEGPALYFGFMREPILIQDLMGGIHNPSYIPWYILETTVSEETSFNAKMLVTKVPLLLYFFQIVGLFLQAWYVCRRR